MKELTYEQVREYLTKQGSMIDATQEQEFKYINSLLNSHRKEQVVETVQKNYDLCDFDRWQHLQDVMFGNSTDTMKYETAMKIDSALWEEDIETLELLSYKNSIQ